MPDPSGFLKYGRQVPPSRPVPLRLTDWREVYQRADDELIREQATRCMNCGIPFCHQGCPLGNLIPTWNDLVHSQRWDGRRRGAARHQQLSGVHRPALPGPVRGSVRARHLRQPGDHQAVEVRSSTGSSTAARWYPLAGPSAPTAAGRRRRLRPGRPRRGAATGPGGARGHALRAQRPDRRPAALRHPRLQAREAPHRPAAGADRWPKACVSSPDSNVGVDVTGERCARTTTPCCSPVARSTRATSATHPAGSSTASTVRMDYLEGSNRVGRRHPDAPPIAANGKHVIVLGGGDTAADCLGTAHRHGAASVHLIEVMPEPPAARDPLATRGRPGR